MLIQVNFSGIRHHLAILREELKIVQQLKEGLRSETTQSITEVNANRKRMEWANKQENWIKNRISLLESAENTLLSADKYAQSALSDAMGMLKSKEN